MGSTHSIEQKRRDASNYVSSKHKHSNTLKYLIQLANAYMHIQKYTYAMVPYTHIYKYLLDSNQNVK